MKPHQHCVLWTPAALEEVSSSSEILKKYSTNKTPPPLAPDVRFSVPPTRLGKVHSSFGRLGLGQLVAIKRSVDAEAHEDEHVGIMITSEDAHYSLVYNLALQEVDLIEHKRLYAPSFLTPAAGAATKAQVLRLARAAVASTQVFEVDDEPEEEGELSSISSLSKDDQSDTEERDPPAG